ncbi:MAG: hypothetical protein A2521_12165 [Deltaproteobacteria bacterium RIFOXYD12_FULL_57_12]|nr:MAG: hypothetical protein A2521_12165 [Deltaproteobacteria bacterium RIFOXYD12_FULL_57_12]
MTTMRLTVPVIAILRGVERDFFGDLMRVSFAVGLQAIEVTMNTAGAEEMVRDCRPEVPAGKFLGMGTIRNLHEAERAAAAGAMFLVTPNLDVRVIEFGRAMNIPVIAGALTPTEIFAAWAAGAAMVKVFPCGAMGGPRYISDLRGPFEMIPLVAVGGVSQDNAAAYLAAGARAVGVGVSFFGREAYQRKNLEEVAVHVEKFLEKLSDSAG